jgi:uncharacterized surface anchored protein
MLRSPYQRTEYPAGQHHIEAGGRSSILKNGFFDKQKNPNHITWNVDVNTTMDNMEAGTTVRSFGTAAPALDYVSAKVYKQNVDIHGNVLAGTQPRLRMYRKPWLPMMVP